MRVFEDSTHSPGIGQAGIAECDERQAKQLYAQGFLCGDL
jgi:hypothetical protein